MPALRQEVHTLSRLGVPDTTARTRWMFGFQRRLVFFLDQGTLWPKPGPLAQTSHTAATGVHSHLLELMMRKTKVEARQGNLASVPDAGEVKRIRRRGLSRPTADDKLRGGRASTNSRNRSAHRWYCGVLCARGASAGSWAADSPGAMSNVGT